MNSLALATQISGAGATHVAVAPPAVDPEQEPNRELTLGRPIEILLVEDSPSDAELTIESLNGSKVANHFSHVVDGVQAMQFLRRQTPYADAPRPDLIMMDLNLPRKDGREVLAELKADPLLQDIPVVVLTSSKDEMDVLHAYQSHCNCYITKPVDVEQFVKVVQTIKHFWLTVVTLPRGVSP